jgi:O-antigen/teichoic acid export membrane protein
VRFFLNINLVFLAYVANYLLAFAAGVLITRALGPTGRGDYQIFLVAVSITQAVVGLGMNVSSIYHIGKKAFNLRDIVSNTQFVVLASVAVSGILVLVATPIFGSQLLDKDVPYWLFVFAVPLFVNFNILTAILQGESRFLEMNLMVLARPLGLLILVAAGMAAGGLSIGSVLAFWLIASLATMLLGLALVGFRNLDLRTVVWPRWRILREQVRFGVQGQIGNLLQLLNYRLDSLLVLAFVNAAGVGFYAVGVAMTESIWFIANAVAVVLLPWLTAAKSEDAAALTPLVCRQTLWVSLVAAVGLGLLSPVLVEALFGSEFGPAVAPVLWLLPGTVAASGTKIVASYIFSQGKPLVNSYITVATLAVTIILDLVLIPQFEVAGAAAASSGAYTVSLVLSLWAYRRLSGQTVLDALLLRPSDVRLYLEAARTVRARYASTGGPQP